MRFIAVFNQLQTVRSLEFESLVDALDFLFWGYEDHELMPQGIYDGLTDKATLYDHAGQFIDGIALDSIRKIAREYLTAISPFAGLMQPSDG
ncbi:hypothetical protein G8759_16675 [Spirosoma aureum]|uniref:Uncharacterized protein n=1 Tax=Spirosoma aureum TaxID=2692134 RepID=A0A6G9ANT0_9BACT|nr:hypothetical protein [Spirosoma aureum]QIP14131.1 hypothetical protein G8759_16675 [Spirosoma aureum]